MRVTEIILIENAEIIQIDEGPKLDALKAAAKSGIKAVGKGAAALGKGALKAAPAVGQAIGSTIGAAAGGLAGGAVRGFKGAKAGSTDYDADTSTQTTKPAPSKTAPSTAGTAPKMTLGNIQKAITSLKPAEQAKLLAYLQKIVKVSPTAPAAIAAPVAKPKYSTPTATQTATV